MADELEVVAGAGAFDAGVEVWAWAGGAAAVSPTDTVVVLAEPQPAKRTMPTVVAIASAAVRDTLLLIVMVFAIAAAHPCTVSGIQEAGNASIRSGYDAQVSTPARPQSLEPAVRRSRRELARASVVALLAVLITLFAVLNVEEVKVNWIFGSSRPPLIVVIVVSLLVGILITHLAGLRSKRRR